MNLARLPLLLSSLLAAQPLLGAATWHVRPGAPPPGNGSSASPFPAIQQGLDRAAPGDTVLAADGVYTGDGNKNLDFRGKAVTLRSANGPAHTVIDCQGFGRGFRLHSGETLSTVVRGFRITGANTGVVAVSGAPGEPLYVRQYGPFGSAIFCINRSGLSLLDCIVENSQSMAWETISTASDPISTSTKVEADGSGGAVYCEGGSLYCSNVVFRNNRAGLHGGGLCLVGGARARLVASTISSNRSAVARTNSANHIVTPISIIEASVVASPGSGGGIYCANGRLELEGCRISHNASVTSGGGLCAVAGAQLVLTRCSLDDNLLEGTTPMTMGGGLASSGGTTDLLDCALRGNQCRQPNATITVSINTPVSTIASVDRIVHGRGGAIAIADALSARVAGCRVEDNVAGLGGGLFGGQVNGLAVSNSGFFANHATGGASQPGAGGAIALRDAACRLANCEFTANGAGTAFDTVSTTAFRAGPSLDVVIVQTVGTGIGGALSADNSRVEASIVAWRGNSAGRDGGGVAIRSNSCLVVRDFSATENQCMGASTSLSLTVHSDDFEEIQTAASFGGGRGSAFFCDGSSMVQQRGVVGENGPAGSTVHLSGHASAELHNVMIIGNAASITTTGTVRRYADGTTTNLSQGRTLAGKGVGLTAEASEALLAGVTLYRNRGTASADGLWATAGSRLTLRNTIVWSNAIAREAAAAVVSHSCVQGGWPGAGNLSADPRLTPAGLLRPGSPAIDAGTSRSAALRDFENEWRVRYRRAAPSGVDIGADEFVDADHDGMSDAWEREHFGGTQASHGARDADLDGLRDVTEYNEATDPNDADTDNDGRSDGQELQQGGDPLSVFS